MSVKVRKYKRKPGRWEVDIDCVLPDWTRFRRRYLAPMSSKSGALRWGEARERVLLLKGPPKAAKEVPTLAEFAPRFMAEHARANQHKPSGVAHKETVLRVHLVPALGPKRLDAITTADIQRLKQALRTKKPKTVNNVLTVLNTLLRKAVEWEVMERMACTIRLLKVSQGAFRFYDFGAFERLVAAAREMDTMHEVIVLLGGEGGLRVGEIQALPWSHVEVGRGQLSVEHSVWRGQTRSTKGNSLRHVPMTLRLADALRRHRHLRNPLVVVRPDNTPMSYSAVVEALHRAARTAGLPEWGPHALRHTFCSHLAMRGAVPVAIQHLAGHKNLATTMRYLHLSPGATEGAIRLLDRVDASPGRGDIVETEDQSIGK
jgi:integrase